jgi:hypothetical protein
MNDYTPKPSKKKDELLNKQMKESICHSPDEDIDGSLGRLHSSIDTAIKSTKDSKVIKSKKLNN